MNTSIRLQDITTVDRSYIESIIAQGDRPIIQFSTPGYSTELLQQIDALCSEFGAKLEVRFYGHNWTSFDASSLTLLPNVAWLSIDCLRSVVNLNALFQLTRLRRLSLGIFELNQADILDRLQADALEELYVCETRKSEIDLSSLARCHSLSRLYIAGHTRGFDSLAESHSISELTLRSIPKKQSLGAVSRMRGLRALTIILGGRADIEEISHPQLRRLEIVWVRGLASLGSLTRFPALERLRVEDQLKLLSVDFETTPSELHDLQIFNCKNLEKIGGLAHLSKLKTFRIGRTKLDFEKLLEAGLPASLRCVAVYTRRKKIDEAMRQRLDALGYTEF